MEGGGLRGGVGGGASGGGGRECKCQTLIGSPATATAGKSELMG